MLFSAGLDSAVLLADAAAATRGRSQPIYVSVGLAWEAEERAMATRLLAHAAYFATSSRSSRFASTCATCTRRPTGRCAARPPGFDTPDEDVYLEGRNVVLLSKAAVFMARAGLARAC